MPKSSRSLQVSPNYTEIISRSLTDYGLTQSHLADELGLSRSTISNFFTGKAIDRLNFIEICNKLSLKWQEISGLKESGLKKATYQQNKKCFILAPVGSLESEWRERFEKIFEIIIKPIVKDLGYEPIRSDKISDLGIVTSQVIEHLVTDDLVIADLTGNNPNVIYELAVRHTIQKPAIQIKTLREKRPFDIEGDRILFFDDKDIESMEKLKQNLKARIIAIEQNPEDIANPVAKYFALEQMKQSLNPAALIAADVSQRLEKYAESFQSIQITLGQILDNSINPNKIKQKNIEARYIDGEKESFAVLTEVSKQARHRIRATRFFPESVLNKPDYVKAMEQRMHGTDGNPALAEYHRIIAINHPDKQRDINHHLNSFLGTPFNIYLTSYKSTFELIIIDDTDAFIHFFKEENIITATLQITGKAVVDKFIEIFNKLKNRDLIAEFNCETITQDELIEKLLEVDTIFKERLAPKFMKKYTMEEVKDDLFSLIDEVAENHQPIKIKWKNNKAILISIKD